MRPRIGCLGLGWIGRHRLTSLVESGVADVTVLYDASPDARASAAAVAPAARAVETFDDLLDAPIDGLMIATPSALHAEQARRALDRGLAVFCQKPLARTRAEAAAIVDTARRRDRLLHVDLSYRFAQAFETLTTRVIQGDVGPPHAIDLTFHNAYGPDKPWYDTRALAGGGCVMDLGIHLIDLARRLCGAADLQVLAAQLFRNGLAWTPDDDDGGVEDLALVQMASSEGTAVRLACSWRLPAGRDAVIEAVAYGPRGGLRAYNVAGSFYDFAADRLVRTQTERLVSPPDAWGGRAAVAWAARLARDRGYDPACEDYVGLADLLDRIYAAASASIRSSASAR